MIIRLKFISTLIFSLTVSLYVFVFNFALYANAKIDISAKNGAILIDANTGEVLYEQDADKIASIASTTKIMSTILALEKCNDLNEIFMVDPKAIQVEGSTMGLLEGDFVNMNALCYGMMLPSGNDAANASAVRIAGSIPKFVNMMNQKAKKLGMENTHFCTPSGLEGDKPGAHHSTARDMAKLTMFAMKNEKFAEICSKTTKKLSYGNPPYDRIIPNHNKLLKQLSGACGVKTGFTDEAGRCLVSAAERDGVKLIAVVLNDKNDWEDSKKLLEYGFSQFELKELPNKFPKVKLDLISDSCSSLGVEATDHIKVKLTEYGFKNIKANIKSKPLHFAPINKEEKIGEVNYYLNNQLIGTVDLYPNLNVTE